MENINNNKTNVKDFVKTFKYEPSYKEAYDTFYALAFRRNRKAILVTNILLTAISIGLLIFFAMDPRRVYALFLAVIAILLLFYIIYHPALSARKGASKVMKAHGYYKFTVHGSGQIDLPDGQKLKFGDDKYARAVETDIVFAIRADSQTTLCIPKRLLSKQEMEKIREIFT